MKSTDDHSVFQTPIGAQAASGTLASIPATQTNPGDGTASIAQGFPAETFIDRAAGGKPPRGADMNGFLWLLSHAVQALQTGYVGPFSAAFAHAIGGYPQGAVVGGGTIGTFWVSTADNNMSVPGQNGAAWQNLFAGLATQAALTAETLRATTIESNLQTNINQKLNLTGGNLTGPLSITAPSSGLTVNSTSNVNTGKNDANIYYSLTNRFGYAATSGLRENVGSSLVYMFAIYNGTEWYEFDLVAQGPNQGRLISPAGVGALTSDLTNFVTQAELTADLNNYVPASAIASGTIAGGTYTRIGNVLTQAFTVSVPSNGTNAHQITYPMKFSEAPSVSFVGDDTENSRSFSLAPGTVPTATSFTITVSGHGNSTYGDTNPVMLSVTAQGPSP